MGIVGREAKWRRTRERFHSVFKNGSKVSSPSCGSTLEFGFGLELCNHEIRSDRVGVCRVLDAPEHGAGVFAAVLLQDEVAALRFVRKDVALDNTNRVVVLPLCHIVDWGRSDVSCTKEKTEPKHLCQRQ